MNIVIAEDKNADETFKRSELDIFISVGKRLAELANKHYGYDGYDIAVDADENIRVYDGDYELVNEFDYLHDFFEELSIDNSEE